MNDEPAFENPLEYGLDATLGMKFHDVEPGRVTGSFEIEDRVRQPFGIVHGGAHAALAESLASIGTYLAVASEGKIAMGMSNNTTFLRSVSEGVVNGEAVAIHQGSTTWVWDVALTDSEGRRCAVSRVTIAVRQRRT